MSIFIRKPNNITLEEIKKIETEIEELNECFKTLNSLIEEQGEQIQTIEDSIHESKETVQIASDELEKASQYQKSNNKLIVGAVVGGLISGALTYGLSLTYTLGSLACGSLLGTYVGSKC